MTVTDFKLHTVQANGISSGDIASGNREAVTQM